MDKIQRREFGPDQAVSNGIRSLLSSYLELSSERRLCIAASGLESESRSSSIAHLIADEARRTGIDTTLHDVSPEIAFSAKAFAHADVVLYVSETQSIHRRELLEHLRTRSTTSPRYYRLFDASREVCTLCFGVNRDELRRLNASVIKSAQSAARIRVVSRFGTDVEITLTNDADWTSSFGWFDGSYPGVLPPGEVNTYTSRVDGIVVADGAINTSFAYAGDPRLENRPIRAEFRKGRLLNAHCDDHFLSMVLNSFLTAENSDRIGEVGFGTNESIGRFVPFRSHINERFPGFHLGLGTPTQRSERLSWSCPVHLDLILDDCEIYFGNTLAFSRGKWKTSVSDRYAESETGTMFVDAL